MLTDNYNDVKMKMILDKLSDLSIKHKSELKLSEIQTKSKYDILMDFLSLKKLEGCSIDTIMYYHYTLIKFVKYFHKPYAKITAEDIREYLINYQTIHDISNRSLDDIRRCISSFFNYLEDDEIINRNSSRKVHKIKYEKTVKKPFTDVEIERIRDSCATKRDKALIDLMISTGCRVGEIVRMDISDLNMENREILVYGKGNKERIVYFDAKTKLHIDSYLKSRNDEKTALFVTSRYPYNRLSKNVIESIVRDISNNAGVENGHPHRFRRTFATNLINRGMPIEQVQILLGHTKLETTTIYTRVQQESVKMNHNRLV